MLDIRRERIEKLISLSLIDTIRRISSGRWLVVSDGLGALRCWRDIVNEKCDSGDIFKT